MADIRDVLREAAIQIRDEHKLGANTAKRIGSLLLALVNSGADIEELEKIFLRKDLEDEAAGLIKFLKGLTSNGPIKAENGIFTDKLEATETVTTLNLVVQSLAEIYDLNVSHVATIFRTIVKDYVSSEQFIPGFTGNGMKLYKALNGDWNLELDNLTVRKAMTVFELIISKIRAVNGGLVISPANGKVKSVLLTNGLYRLEIEDDMMFVADDLVRCQSFSVKSGVKYYWVRITSVSGSYIFINASEFTNSLPAVDDDLVQFGNKTNKARQGLLYLTAAEDGKPRISVLDGVDSTDLTDKTKVILGCLDDITDMDFPADYQPHGHGLYGVNVFLKGMFILRNGKTIEDELGDKITAVQAAFEIREGQISTKVTEVTKKATEAASSATNAATSATNAKASADSAAAKLTTITQKESSINQTASNITLQVTEVTTKVSQASTSAASASNAAELATAMSRGRMLYRDPSFEKGVNGISVYNNLGNGAVTVVRVSGITGNPNGSGYCLKITSTGSASPGWGGWLLAPNVKANQRLVYRFIANIPAGRSLAYARNGAGDGVVEKWLTPQAGTGKWEEYAYILCCGGTGTFSGCGHFYLTGGAAPTTAAPLIWYVAYATVFDVTDAEIDYIADAAGKYTTKTEHSSSITQLSNSIELKVAKTDFNALGTRVSTAETTIRQHTDQIALKAAKTDVTALGTRVSAAEAKITPDAIQLTVKSQTDSIVSAAIKRTEVWVDATGLDASKYYPITMVLSLYLGTYTISVSRELGTAYGKPSWSTHENGFSVLCRWTTNACAWGNREVKRTILDYTSSFANVTPIGSIGQLTNWSEEYIYVRGGSKYRVIVEGETGVSITLRASGYTHTSSGYTQSAPILTAVTTPVPDLNLRPTTDTIKSQFTIDTSGISMLGKKIALTGMVTFSSLDSAAQSTINGKATPAQIATAKSEAISTAASDATTKANNALTNARNDVAVKLGYSSYTDMVNKAAASQTIISGGYIRTSLIDANAVVTNTLLATKIAATAITTGKLTVTSGAKIGGWNIVGNDLSCTNASGAKIIVEPSGTRFLRINDAVTELMAIRADGVTGIRIYTQDSTGKCLTMTAQTGGTAIESYGNHNFTAREGEKTTFAGYTNTGGLGVMVRRITGTTTLNHSDCWVSCYNTGTITVYLPSNPQVGKMMFIMRVNNAAVNVNGNGKSIKFWTAIQPTAAISNTGEIDIYVYDGQYWMNGWFKI